MDTNIQIQSLKSQIDNMKLQINNIELQNNNMNMMMGSTINDQFLNLSIQMFNAGIQSFTTGKNLYMSSYPEKFYKQIKDISKQINFFISEYKISKQQKMLQPLFPNPMIPYPIPNPVIQNPMMQNPVNPIPANPNEVNPIPVEPIEVKPIPVDPIPVDPIPLMIQFENELYKFRFKNASGLEEKEIEINKNASVKELLNKFKKETGRISIDGFNFLCGGENIKNDEERKVKDLFGKDIIFFNNLNSYF